MARSHMQLRLVPGELAPATAEADDDGPIADLERAVAGDVTATRRLLARVGPAVQRTARGVLGPDHPDLDDAVQEALLGFVRALPAFRGECPLRGFAIRIAWRVAFGISRKRTRRDRLDARVHCDDRSITDPRAELARADVLAILRRHLRTLRPEQAETVVLRWVLGHSLGDVARITGVPVNTVRSRLRLARNTLSERLKASPEWRELFDECGGRR